MSAKRDSLFPSASVGRAQGVHIVRTPSRESLAVHPLLNAPHHLDSAKYVPYTPRQRQPTTATATPVQPTTTAPSQGSVPAKPHIANLRAAAQSIGLESNSIGWAILEKISFEGDTSDEWSEIWNALIKSRATLLLPSEPSSGHESITPEFVQDHLILCDLASRENTAVVTLSGLRGHLVNDSLTFRSTLHRSTKPFQALLAPSASRVASLDALPPLPDYPPESSYPSFTVSAFSATLPLPLRATKPPLPPRPGARSAQASSSARLSMPFASLFGHRPSTPPPFPPTTTTTTTAHTSTATDVDSTIDISAFVIDTVLSRTEIATGIIGALKGEIAIALNDQPPWIVERVHTFALPYFPFVKLPAGKKKLQDIGGNPNRVVYAVNAALDKPEEYADKFQAFYRAVEAELRNTGRVRAEEGTHVDGLDTSGLQDAEPEREEQVDEAQIRDVLETIEATLCTLLYDRLFLPSTSDDASHNEALSSRVAALNMLDLGLEHLDIDIGDANHAEVDAVVRTCGQTLAQLDLSARSPREKAAVLVSAHKLVVEGLSKIPPVRLKSRDDAEMVPMNHSSDPTETTEHASTPAASIPVPPQESTNIQSPSMPAIHLSTSPNQPSIIEQAPSSETIAHSTSSPVSGDVLLPILIFSVVKANPSKLVSHLLFTQRFRNQAFGGEESYCLINLMAVAEFLENVDLGALGLGESEKKVLSTADLTPIPITRPNMPESPTAPTLSGEEHLANLRGRVGQGVDAIAGSANKVISGVFDSSFGVLRALLPGQTSGNGIAPGSALSTVSGSGSASGPGSGLAVGSGTGSGAGSTSTGTGAGDTDAAPWGVRPSLGLIRRETGFSIAGLTVALPGGPGRARSQSHPEEQGQRELVEVSSRPASLKSHRSGHEASEDENENEEGSSADEESEEEEGDGEEEEAEEEGKEAEEDRGHRDEGEEGGDEQAHDTRSIKSFESMLSSGRTTRKKAGAGSSPAAATTTTTGQRRKRLTDLTDRLTHGMAGMSRRVQGGDVQRQVVSGRLPPPHRRFMECTEQDIRVSEVGELLREYQRLVEAVRNAGGFQE
ncbi:hypothetical protein EV363DRAFT_35915 [Boletus edulis]|nr:hypothetical protein EV363DRAFT_35915 [Boletus edulis]